MALPSVIKKGFSFPLDTQLQPLITSAYNIRNVGPLTGNLSVFYNTNLALVNPTTKVISQLSTGISTSNAYGMGYFSPYPLGGDLYNNYYILGVGTSDLVVEMVGKYSEPNTYGASRAYTLLNSAGDVETGGPDYHIIDAGRLNESLPFCIVYGGKLYRCNISNYNGNNNLYLSTSFAAGSNFNTNMNSNHSVYSQTTSNFYYTTGSNIYLAGKFADGPLTPNSNILLSNIKPIGYTATTFTIADLTFDPSGNMWISGTTGTNVYTLSKYTFTSGNASNGSITYTKTLDSPPAAGLVITDSNGTGYYVSPGNGTTITAGIYSTVRGISTY